jgi:hypothetical protein
VARRRLNRKSAKARRHSDPLSALFDDLVETRPVEPASVRHAVPTPAVHTADRIERLTYTRLRQPPRSA